MIEQGVNYVDSIVKEMTDFFETRVKSSSLSDSGNIWHDGRNLIKKHSDRYLIVNCCWNTIKFG